MGLAELAVFIGPLLVTQLAFRRYAGIRATYLQTVRSLARVTEVAGYVEAGHSERVSMLAVSVGRGLGMSERELLALEYAALMHDIGQLSLREPIPGGATLLVSAPDAERIAELGADVIRQAGVLDHVAELVRSQVTVSVAEAGAATQQRDHQGGERLRRHGRRLGRPQPGGRGARPAASGPARVRRPGGREAGRGSQPQAAAAYLAVGCRSCSNRF